MFYQPLISCQHPGQLVITGYHWSYLELADTGENQFIIEASAKKTYLMESQLLNWFRAY
jgi:hypothetical protein